MSELLTHTHTHTHTLMHHALIKGALQRANIIKKKKDKRGESLRSLEEKPDLFLKLNQVRLWIFLSFDPFLSFFSPFGQHICSVSLIKVVGEVRSLFELFNKLTPNK